MSNPRTPTLVAIATGRTVVNPARYADRADPVVSPIGAPPDHFGLSERARWGWFTREVSWLVETDRPTVELACQLWAKAAAGFISDAQRGQLMRLNGQLGLTAVDRSRVTMPPAEPEPEDV